MIWDTNHYLTFVHYTFPSTHEHVTNRFYLQFGVLIDRRTLRPIGVIPKPLVTGGSETGRHDGVHYTMSLIVEGDVLYAFYGEGDMHTGVVVFDKAALGEEFRRHYTR